MLFNESFSFFFFPKKFWNNLYNIMELLSNLLKSVKTLRNVQMNTNDLKIIV